MVHRIIARESSAHDDAPLLEVTGLSTTFRTAAGPVSAVDDVSLTVDQGRTLGIVGESGSGKSVLSRSIMGLLPARNVTCTGSVRYRGIELNDMSDAERRSLWGDELSMIFQDPMTSLNPVMRIGHQITESLRHHLELGRGEADELAISLLRQVRIPEPARRLRQYPHELSGGMRQRVVIAVALACGPHLLFADEPTTALDVTVQAQILDLLDRQQAERFMSMILVTHDLGVVAGRAEEIAVMYAGRIVEIAPTRALFSDMRMPYTQALFDSIPKIGWASHTRLHVIPGRPPDLARLPRGCAFAPRCDYAQDRCLEERPTLREAQDPPAGRADAVRHGLTGHRFACFYPVGTAEGRDALARNVERGSQAAGVEVRVAPGSGSQR